MQLSIRYFAWVRERVGVSEETVDVPADVATVAALIGWLVARGPEYVHAFSEPRLIRAAIDQVHVKSDARLNGAREIAFFPPVTGG